MDTQLAAEPEVAGIGRVGFSFGRMGDQQCRLQRAMHDEAG